MYRDTDIGRPIPIGSVKKSLYLIQRVFYMILTLGICTVVLFILVLRTQISGKGILCGC